MKNPYVIIKSVDQLEINDRNELINKSKTTEEILEKLTYKIKFKRKINLETPFRQLQRNTIAYKQIYSIVSETLKEDSNYYNKRYKLSNIDYSRFREKIAEIKENEFNKNTSINSLKVNWYSNTIIEYEMLKEYLENELNNKKVCNMKLIGKYAKSINKCGNDNNSTYCKEKR